MKFLLPSLLVLILTNIVQAQDIEIPDDYDAPLIAVEYREAKVTGLMGEQKEKLGNFPTYFLLEVEYTTGTIKGKKSYHKYVTQSVYEQYALDEDVYVVIITDSINPYEPTILLKKMSCLEGDTANAQDRSWEKLSGVIVKKKSK